MCFSNNRFCLAVRVLGNSILMVSSLKEMTPLPAVAGHLSDGDREGADRRHHPGLSFPHRQHFLAHLVLPQPLSQVAASGPALPNLLRHVRLHGHRLHRYTSNTTCCKSPQHRGFWRKKNRLERWQRVMQQQGQQRKQEVEENVLIRIGWIMQGQSKVEVITKPNRQMVLK